MPTISKRMGQQMSHIVDNDENHASKKRKRGGDGTAAEEASSTSATSTTPFATEADAIKLRQMMDQNLSQMKRMENIMDRMETRLARVDYLEDRCKELEERCKLLERSNGKSNEAAPTSASGTKKRGRGRPPKKLAQSANSASKKSPPSASASTSTKGSTPKSVTLNVPSADSTSTTTRGSAPQSKISPNATIRNEMKYKSKQAHSAEGEDETSSPLFAFPTNVTSQNAPSTNTNDSSRPKRKLKAITRFDPDQPNKSPASMTGTGFACPKCSHICSYGSRVCEECGMECCYEAGVGVVVLKERNGRGSGSSDSLPQQQLQKEKKKMGAAAGGAVAEKVVESVKVAIIPETATLPEMNDDENNAKSDATSAGENGKTANEPEKGIKPSALASSSENTKSTTTLEPPIPKRGRGRPRKSVGGFDGSHTKQKSHREKMGGVPHTHRTRSKSLTR